VSISMVVTVFLLEFLDFRLRRLVVWLLLALPCGKAIKTYKERNCGEKVGGGINPLFSGD
jgi:hypothetical protein